MWRKTRSDDGLTLTLSDIEVTVLAQLLDDLDELSEDPSPHDPVAGRLYPAGYADADAAAEFRDLTQTSLQQDRRNRYGQCRAELPDGGGDIVVEAESVHRWLVVINDMRLALGTRLGVTADGFTDEVDGRTSAAENQAARTVYQWLTAIQDDIVTSLLR